mmetsp:Transcript_2608/g.4747  ORF Transcript_2608/g.4747 Transcript_2608/m.4747 type:complete len:331 (+) Transcript_2608:199-1191(+)
MQTMDEWSFFRNQIHINKEIINLRKKSQQSLQQFRDNSKNLDIPDPGLEAKLDKFMTESMKTLDVERQHNSNFEKSFKTSSKRILGTDEERDVFKKVKWNNHEDKCMSKAAGIVQRYLARGGVLPRQKDKDLEKVNPERLQEDEDSNCLYHWRLGLKGSTAFVCSEKVKCYLDENMPHWRDELADRAMNKAVAIVARYKARQHMLLNEQDKKDNKKLAEWKKAVEQKNQGPRKCPDKVRDYLDEQIPGWRMNKTRASKASRDLTAQLQSDAQKTDHLSTSSSSSSYGGEPLLRGRDVSETVGGHDMMYHMGETLHMGENGNRPGEKMGHK